jgi:hypothetical protein
MNKSLINKKLIKIRSIENKIEAASVKKKKIDSQISDLKSERESLRLFIEEEMKSSNTAYQMMEDGTEISIRNSPKSYEWTSDEDVMSFLKTVGKFDSICSLEISINKKKLKSFFDDLSNCDGLPEFVTIKQDKVMQIRSPSLGLPEKNAPSVDKPVSQSGIDEIDVSSLDGI